MAHAPTRIGLFLPRFSRYGGVEGFGVRFAEALAGAGYAVDFICARQESEPPAGVRVIPVGRYGLLRAGKMAWFMARAEQIRRRERHDLTIGLGQTLQQDILRIGGAPLKEFWRLSRRAYPPGAARSWKQFTRRIRLDTLVGRMTEPAQFRNAKRIIAVSDMVADLILRAHPSLDPDTLQVIYNKPDLVRFSPAVAAGKRRAREKWGLPSDAVVVSTAATNFALKGTGVLIQSVSAMAPETHLLVAGGRNPGALAPLARELGVEDRVHFAGRVEDMPSVYRASDVFALPTFYDACANSVLEALACNVPAVSTTTNGSSVFLPDWAVLKDAGDATGLTAALERALREPAPALALPQKSRRTVGWGMEAYLDLVADSL